MKAALFPDLVVNGEIIPQTLVAAETQNHPAPAGKPGIAWRKAANAIAMRALLLQKARQRGFTPAPAEVAPGRFETEEEALIRALMDEVIDVTPPTAAAVEAEWQRDPSRFRAPPLWEASHILCACDPRDEEARKMAEARAQALCTQALADPRGFNRLAKDQSDCGSKSSGGALGQLGPGDTVPEFEAAMRRMTEGEITAEPVLTRHGWHVIRLDALAEGAVLPFEAVRSKIAEAMEKAEWARAARAFAEDLVTRAEITGADLQRA